jgi:hypothetical protein
VVLKEAVVTPPVVLTFIGLPAGRPSIWNWTVPVGVPVEPGAATLTVAVKVTLSPDTDGLSKDATAVLVLVLAMNDSFSTTESGVVAFFPPKA